MVHVFGAWKRTDSQRDPNDTLELQAETVGPAECKSNQIQQQPFRQVARCPTHHEQVYQAERTSMPPPNVQTKTRHGLHKASCSCRSFFKKLSHPFLASGIFVKHHIFKHQKSIPSLDRSWLSSWIHVSSAAEGPISFRDKRNDLPRFTKGHQGQIRSTLWQTWSIWKYLCRELIYPTLGTGKSSSKVPWDRIY